MTGPSVTAPSPSAADNSEWDANEVAEVQPVSWLSPRGLLRTGQQVAQGSIFARYADKREVMWGSPPHLYDVAARHGVDQDLWLDYVADTGDGFDATYTVAASITRAHLIVQDPPQAPQPLGQGQGCDCARPEPVPPMAGDVLMLGGDEVYPVASVKDYDDRMKKPFRTATEAASALPGRPLAFAIPGNHDWYDGLVAFRRNFCESWVKLRPHSGTSLIPPTDSTRLDRVGNWRVLQSRSYFAVRLPHNWWLWGIDIQLDAPIDAAQLAYFRTAAHELKQADGRLILCTARPSWIDDPDLDDSSDLSDKQTLTWFVRRFVGKEDLHRVRLMLSGDKHHYARYEPADSTKPLSPMLVTCGGGGAYLSSTHHLPITLTPFTGVDPAVTAAGASYARDKNLTTYPTDDRSRAYRKETFSIPGRNKGLSVLVAGVYALLLWALSIGMTGSVVPHPMKLHWAPFITRWSWSDPTWSALPAFIPFGLLVVAMAFGLKAYAGFGAKKTSAKHTLAGFGHATAHLGVVYVAAGLIGMWQSWLDFHNGWARFGMFWVAVVVLALVLWALGHLGTAVFAAYLLVCDLPSLGLHETEYFSGLRIVDYKCHLRIHVTKDQLHVRAIGIDEVPEKWRLAFERGADKTSSYKVPVDGPTTARYIDQFAVSRDPASATG